MGRAQDLAVEHAREIAVEGVLRLSRDLEGAVQARDARPDDVPFRGPLVGHALPPPLHAARGLLAGLERAGLRPAAADVAVERAAEVVAARVGILLEAGGAGDDEAGRAEAAHQAVALHELLL